MDISVARRAIAQCSTSVGRRVTVSDSCTYYNLTCDLKFVLCVHRKDGKLQCRSRQWSSIGHYQSNTFRNGDLHDPMGASRASPLWINGGSTSQTRSG